MGEGEKLKLGKEILTDYSNPILSEVKLQCTSHFTEAPSLIWL